MKAFYPLLFLFCFYSSSAQHALHQMPLTSKELGFKEQVKSVVCQTYQITNGDTTTYEDWIKGNNDYHFDAEGRLTHITHKTGCANPVEDEYIWMNDTLVLMNTSKGCIEGGDNQTVFMLSQFKKIKFEPLGKVIKPKKKFKLKRLKNSLMTVSLYDRKQQLVQAKECTNKLTQN